ncbi:type II toxin-antitoxin system RelE/ParE family toxin [Paraglaciecola sp. MB-3u-78]|jgi:toxin ParE1/3/4|uniref:type II toxin-antitoxin system RelE/ParE family toxin n=1 Tax=Paraglaciecola sp. MB-3u-78 TaxID=2058332 RepID=UPI000C326593|nr:type II toxin-antitoxin system RelE/ParE family toxin [Paraglaciecola sp. MB-3u-78]PKG99990.1 type II toxin-antitoxin system RelE/ParE family toxin [Paraglaciecola sp. MB-3u-78]
MSNYAFTPEALEDLNNIVLYTLTKWGKSQAKNYVDGLNLLASRLAETPLVGRPRSELHDVLYSFPYASHIIYYISSAKGITIIRVLHKNMGTTKHL